MSSINPQTNFTMEYVVSVVVVLVSCNMIMKFSPQMNSALVVIVGLLIGYLTLLIMNTLFPAINQIGANISDYYSSMFMNNFNNMGYVNVWPPIIAVLIIFIVLLYNRKLG